MKNTPMGRLSRITIRIIVGAGLLGGACAHVYAQDDLTCRDGDPDCSVVQGQGPASVRPVSKLEPIEVVRARLELAEAVAQAQGALAGLKQQEDALLAAQVRYQQAAEAVEQAKQRAEKARVALERLTGSDQAP